MPIVVQAKMYNIIDSLKAGRILQLVRPEQYLGVQRPTNTIQTLYTISNATQGSVAISCSQSLLLQLMTNSKSPYQPVESAPLRMAWRISC